MGKSSSSIGRAARTTRTKGDAFALGRVLWSLTLVAIGVFLFVSLASFNPGDPPTHLVYPANNPTRNLCGPAGAWASYQLVRALGLGSWILVLCIVLHALLTLAGKRIAFPALRLVGVIMFAAAIAGLQAALLPRSGRLPSLTGGVVGASAWAELSLRFGPVGAGVWMILLLAVGGIVAFDRWLYLAPAWIIGAGAPAARRAGEVAFATAGATAKMGGGLAGGLGSLLKNREQPVRVRANDLDDEAETFNARRRRKNAEIIEADAEENPSKKNKTKDVNEDIVSEVVEHENIQETADAPSKSRGRRKADDSTAITAATTESDASEDEAEEDDTPGAPQVFDADALREKIAKLPIAFGGANKTIATEENLRDLQNVADLPGYKFPALDLLEEPEANFNATLEEYVREQATALESALQQYRIDGTVDSIESGPVITLYHLKLAPGTKVAALEAVSKDLARSLKAVNIRIVPNMVGRDTVGIEVPNTHKEKVRLKELMSKSELFAKMKLPMFLGKDAAGQPLIVDLSKAPHMLIAGTTGSGKSVCMNTIIMGFLYTKKPNELKLVLVDPKMVEMSQFKDIPHLMCPVVTEMSKAAAILEWACTKMDERYELLAEAGCRDIAGYNDLTWEELRERFNPKTPEEEARIPRKLPYMVFVIDELADLMMTNKEVEGSIIRIAQKARAVGIHLILATQRPQANVVTGLIKSNMPTRISFKVASGMDSRIVLDQKGGELLLGQGDMLYIAPSSSKLMRAQGTLVDDAEIRKVVRFMRDIASPSFERQLMTIRKEGDDETRILQSQNNSSASLAAAQEDPMFFRACEIVLETKRGSVSLLQRRLAIGYTRASRLIDLMGIAGIISDHKGSVARDVLITLDEWNAMKSLVEADLSKMKQNTTGQGELFTPGAEGGAAAETGDAETSGDSAPQERPVAASAGSMLDETPPNLEDAAPWEGEPEDEFPDAFKDEEGNERDIQR
jgi:S-DNA-T family DNA segregation ATPase FtsK/SpoIIIE